MRQFGVCLVRLKRLGPAEQVFARLVSANPADGSSRRSLAAVQLLAGRQEAAIDSLGPILAGSNPDPEALALASAAYERSGDTPKAVAALRQAIVLSPQRVSYYLDFANLSFAHTPSRKTSSVTGIRVPPA